MTPFYRFGYTVYAYHPCAGCIGERNALPYVVVLPGGQYEYIDRVNNSSTF